MMIPYILTQTTLTVVTDGQVYNIDNSHVNWEDIKTELKDYVNGEYGSEEDFLEVLETLMDVAKEINTYGKGLVKVIDGVVTYKDTEVRGVLVDRMMDMMAEGFDIKPMALFLENLMENPSYKSREDLYRFLEANNHPLTEDGCFLAYKNVNEDYMDKHSRTFRNQVGDVCKMNRSDVNDDSNQTCSAGLHVCSKEYLNGFWGTSGHTMIVKVNPRDVVSVPYDYKDSKMRTCEYTVIGEVDRVESHEFTRGVHQDNSWISWDAIEDYTYEGEPQVSGTVEVRLADGSLDTGWVEDFFWGDCDLPVVAYRVLRD